MKFIILFFLLFVSEIFSFCYVLNKPYTQYDMKKIIKKSTLPPGKELFRTNNKYLLKGPLTSNQIDYFFNTGFVIVENLIDNKLLKKIKKINIEKEMTATEYDSINLNSFIKYPILLEVANKIGLGAAQLTPLVSDFNDDLHIVKDALFSFDGGENGNNTGCNWHVDDAMFWPSDIKSLGPGINAWLAIDDIDENGGGICIAPNSHNEKFVKLRHQLGISIRKFKKYQKINTCNIEKINPEYNKILNNICYAPILNSGDVIFSTRFLFHKTSTFINPNKKKNIKRYTIRYMPSSSTMNGVKNINNNIIKYFPNKTINELYNYKNYKKILPKIDVIKKYKYKYNYDYN
jgi:ectoine hydroxylase-related dioxygenase (phytanoyl-CoA dioxygenase family)